MVEIAINYPYSSASRPPSTQFPNTSTTKLFGQSRLPLPSPLPLLVPLQLPLLLPLPLSFLSLSSTEGAGGFSPLNTAQVKRGFSPGPSVSPPQTPTDARARSKDRASSHKSLPRAQSPSLPPKTSNPNGPSANRAFSAHADDAALCRHADVPHCVLRARVRS
jgi:hypothetical protein